MPTPTPAAGGIDAGGVIVILSFTLGGLALFGWLAWLYFRDRKLRMERGYPLDEDLE